MYNLFKWHFDWLFCKSGLIDFIFQFIIHPHQTFACPTPFSCCVVRLHSLSFMNRGKQLPSTVGGSVQCQIQDEKISAVSFFRWRNASTIMVISLITPIEKISFSILETWDSNTFFPIVLAEVGGKCLWEGFSNRRRLPLTGSDGSGAFAGSFLKGLVVSVQPLDPPSCSRNELRRRHGEKRKWSKQSVIVSRTHHLNN